jgi:ABC-type antimicrobial peptide transport system permease subunit
MALFAVLALVLALSGVYGVMAYRVSLRQQEIGVRVALGATALDVLRATLGQALRLAAVGLALGLVASVAVGRLVGSVLRGAGGLEWPVALGAAALLALAALAAAFVPARRLLALHPADVLRAE